MTRAEFIQLVAPTAQQVRREGSKILPSITIAQAILESGGYVNDWFNLFGIKATGSPNEYWDGSYVVKGTREVVEGQNTYPTQAFRAYKSLWHGLKDHDRLLNSANYKQVQDSTTPEDQAVALYRCGYATDAPREIDGDAAYYEKLLDIINSNGLRTYDDVQVDSQPQTEGGRKLMLDQTLQTMLGDAITELSKIGQPQNGFEPVLSYEWAEKAYKGELTVDEAVAISIIATARLQGKIVEARS